MGPDDFAPSDSKPMPPAAPRRALAPSAEDEDLFDFPVIVMRASAPAASARSSPPIREPVEIAPIATGSSVTPAPPSHGISGPRKPPGAPQLPSTPGSTPRIAPGNDEPDMTAGERVLQHAPGPTHETAPATGRAESEHDATVQRNADIEAEAIDLLAATGAIVRHARRSIARPKRRRRQLALVAIGSLLILNLLVFCASWKINRDFRAGLESLRADLGFSARETQAQAADRAPAPERAERATHPTALHAEPTGPASAARAEPQPHATAPVALEAFERTALAVARQELESGAFVAARTRLARLLAVVDRIEAAVRDDIEAQAGFLVADSYRRQSQARREVAR